MRIQNCPENVGQIILLGIHLATITSTFKFWPRRRRVVGISDGYRTETILKKIYRTRYRNYHYHQDPHLDISTVPVEFRGTASVICCSEVLEHVAPPVGLAFDGLFSILKPGGDPRAFGTSFQITRKARRALPNLDECETDEGAET